MTRKFELGIKVTVETPSDKELVTPLVNQALRELMNRADFVDGLVSTGRIVEFERDWGDIKVAVDLSTTSETQSTLS